MAHYSIRVARNRYNLTESVQAYIRFREATIRSELGGGTLLTTARTNWVETRARLAQLELQAGNGELVPIKDVARAWAAVVITLRAHLLAMPSHISARCGAPDSQSRARVHEIAEQLIYDALEELSAVEIEAIS